MNKLFLATLLLITALIAAPNAKAQTYIHGDIEAMTSVIMSHDSAQCASTCNPMFFITIHNSFMGDSVWVIDTSAHLITARAGNSTGDTAWHVTLPIPMYMNYVTDDQLSGSAANFLGPIMKLVSGADTINGIMNFYSLTVTNPCVYGDVTGRTYIDNNGNCIYDGGDVALNAMQITTTAHLTGLGPSSRTWMTNSNTSGLYTQKVQRSWMTSYDVTLPPDYYFVYPLSSCFTGAYTLTTLPRAGVDFPLECSSSVDVECWAGSPYFAQPLRSFFLHPTVSNTGCDSASGQMKLVKDSRVVYNPGLSPYPADAVSGDTLIWNYANLTNLTTGAYWNSLLGHVHMTPNSTVAIGDTLCFRIYTNILATDINPANNDYTICLPVVAAYDPNAKQVVPQGTGTAGNIPVTTSELTYTLYFQNTGTAPATIVKVVDSLDSHVNPSTLKVLSTSHPMHPVWLAPGVVSFNFPGINLADSGSNEPASHGYVRFSVKLDAGLAVGTQIRNKGYIYFDSNPAVLTNSVLNTLVSGTAISTNLITEGDVKVYPNPVTDKITIENLQNGRFIISDITGKVIIEQEMHDNITVLDISKYPAGVYILKTIDGKNTTAIKFTKE